MGLVECTVVSRSPHDRQLLPRIRKWCSEPPERRLRGLVHHVSEARDLPAAVSCVRRNPQSTVLVALGFDKSQVRDALGEESENRLEVIITSPTPTFENEDYPSSSLLETSTFVAVTDPIPAIRKSVIKLSLKPHTYIRPLDSDKDFIDYFSLRYKIFKDLGYIPAEKEATRSRWELDYTDRMATPLGAFSPDGTLLGCTRLVRALGREVPQYASRIRSLVKQSGDPQLASNFLYPRNMEHPYDILESFPNFRSMFRRFVRERITNAEISRVIVRPDFRHQGLGEALVDSLVTVAKSKRIHVLILACLKRHQSFYENCGFRLIEDMTCDSFVNIRVPAIAMERWLKR